VFNLSLMRGLIALAVAAATLASPTVAQAHRRASRGEKAAMMYHAGSHYDHLSAKQVDAPRSYPLKCAIADVSTLNNRWGGWGFNGKMYNAHGCRKWASNGFVIEHKIGSRWYVVTEGSTPRPVRSIPRKVLADLVAGLG
jgi:hypothetical protein